MVILVASVSGCTTPWHWLMAKRAPSTTIQVAPQTPPSGGLIVPQRVQLACDGSTTTAYDGVSDCTDDHMYRGDTLAFYVVGMTVFRATLLCQLGYQGKWYANGRPLTSSPNMCRSLSTGWWESGRLEAGYYNPGVLGTVHVTWRLTGPSGYVRQAHARFQVLETQFKGQSSPS